MSFRSFWFGREKRRKNRTVGRDCPRPLLMEHLEERQLLTVSFNVQAFHDFDKDRFFENSDRAALLVNFNVRYDLHASLDGNPVVASVTTGVFDQATLVYQPPVPDLEYEIRAYQLSGERYDWWFELDPQTNDVPVDIEPLNAETGLIGSNAIARLGTVFDGQAYPKTIRGQLTAPGLSFRAFSWDDLNGDGRLNGSPTEPSHPLTLELTGPGISAGPATMFEIGQQTQTNVNFSVPLGTYHVEVTDLPAGAIVQQVNPFADDIIFDSRGMSEDIVVDTIATNNKTTISLPIVDSEGPSADVPTVVSDIEFRTLIDLTPGNNFGDSNDLVVLVDYHDADILLAPDDPETHRVQLIGPAYPLTESTSFQIINNRELFNLPPCDAGEDCLVIAYIFPAPAGGWDPTRDAGSYLVNIISPSVEDNQGHPTPGGFLATPVTVTDNLPPLARLFGEPTWDIGPGTLPPNMANTLDLIVRFEDESGIDAGTLSTGNIAYIRDEQGFVEPLELIGITEASAFRAEAEFRFTPPSGAFNKASEGKYTIVTGLVPLADGDPNPNVLDDSNPVLIDEFFIDFTPPTAVTEVQSDVQSGDDSFEFTVVWSDTGAGVDASSVADALRIDPGGLVLIPQLISAVPFEAQATYRATYRLAAPEGGFPSADYTISTEAGKGSDAVGNVAEQSQIIGSFTVRDGTVINVLAGKKFTLADALGRIGDAALKSKTGQAVIVAAGTEIVTEQISKTKEKITGQIEKLTSIVVSETGIADAFGFKSSKGSDRYEVDDVRVESPIGTLDLSGLNVLGNVSVDAAKKLITGNVQDDHLIEIGEPADGITAIDITLDRVANTDLISLTPIKTLTVTEWIDDDGDPDRIIAPWIGKIVVKGDKKENIPGNFEADVVLTGVGAPKGVSLGSIKVPGDVRESIWDITGDVGSVDIKGAAVDWSLENASTYKSIKMGASTNVRVDIGDGDGGPIQAEKWTGSFVGGSIKSITGKANKNTGEDGDINIAVNLSGHSDPRKATLGKVNTKGDFVLQTMSPVEESSDPTLAPIVGDADSITADYFEATAAFTGDIKSIKVDRIGATALQARSIKSIDVKSDIEILQVLLTQDYDAANPKQTALGRFKSKASHASVIQILSRGNIGSVEFDSLNDATIAAGVVFEAHLAGEPLYSVIQDLGNHGPAIALPTDAGGFVSQATLKSFKLKTGAFVNNSQLAAWQIDKVDLPAISEGSPGTIVANFIKSLKIGGDVGSVKLKNVDENNVPDPVGAFEIRIVV